MSAHNTGGPAFPLIRDIRHNADWDHEAGMTLRDYFAAKAMLAILGGVIAKTENEAAEVPELVSGVAYLVADAMLAERAK